MPTFKVSVNKTYYQTGTISVEADDEDQAIQKVHKMMVDPKMPLQTFDPRINWGGLVYEDDSFTTTGDIDKE